MFGIQPLNGNNELVAGVSHNIFKILKPFLVAWVCQQIGGILPVSLAAPSSSWVDSQNCGLSTDQLKRLEFEGRKVDVETNVKNLKEATLENYQNIFSDIQRNLEILASEPLFPIRELMSLQSKFAKAHFESLTRFAIGDVRNKGFDPEEISFDIAISGSYSNGTPGICSDFEFIVFFQEDNIGSAQFLNSFIELGHWNLAPSKPGNDCLQFCPVNSPLFFSMDPFGFEDELLESTDGAGSTVVSTNPFSNTYKGWENHVKEAGSWFSNAAQDYKPYLRVKRGKLSDVLPEIELLKQNKFNFNLMLEESYRYFVPLDESVFKENFSIKEKFSRPLVRGISILYHQNFSQEDSIKTTNIFEQLNYLIDKFPGDKFFEKVQENLDIVLRLRFLSFEDKSEVIVRLKPTINTINLMVERIKPILTEAGLPRI